MTTLLEALKAAEDALEQNRLHLAGITPDRNTQTAEEAQATLDGLFRLTGEALTLIRQAREGDGWQETKRRKNALETLAIWRGKTFSNSDEAVADLGYRLHSYLNVIERALTAQPLPAAPQSKDSHET